ncbi:hypothetical protein CDL12_15517 [Handroanthus impetiginosus]|uniref:Uncharacterized protein n=1 Tax=Handroanthus impetiginosus TaxID=429701 RepID=A0A2G9H2W8_9LAMI|nr:hypothetical protein CDL12_15517 [Handroanthus impetiginosus]
MICCFTLACTFDLLDSRRIIIWSITDALNNIFVSTGQRLNRCLFSTYSEGNSQIKPLDWCLTASVTYHYLLILYSFMFLRIHHLILAPNYVKDQEWNAKTEVESISVQCVQNSVQDN